MTPLRLLLVAIGAVVIGAGIAAHPAPADDACLLHGTGEGTAWTTDLQVWPVGLECEMSDGTSYVLGASVAETLVVTAAVAALLLVAASRWDTRWARALASALALLGLIGVLAHALGYPGLPMFAAFLAWPVAYAIQRDWLAGFLVCACVLPIWLFFDLWGEPRLGLPLATALAVLAAARITAPPDGLVGRPAPPR